MGPVERLTRADLAACLALAVERGWAPEAEKWRLLLEVGAVFGVRAAGGRVVGTVVVTGYQPELAALSMVLVSSEYARRGLGARLMDFAVGWAAPARAFLYATVMGEPLYRRLGFGTVGTVVRHRGRFRADGERGGVPVRVMRSVDLVAVVEMDRVAFGASRERVLGRMVSAAEYGVVAEHGFALGWRNRDTLMVGPVVAADEHTTVSLVHAVVSRATIEVLVDLHAHATRAAVVSEWLVEHGLPTEPAVPLMTAGGVPLPGARHQLYSPIMQALG